MIPFILLPIEEADWMEDDRDENVMSVGGIY